MRQWWRDWTCTFSQSSTLTPAHLLSVQVLEDETMVEGLDWYILPVLNPDGYQFTHEHVNLIR
jgi:hypothetical protein